MMRGAGSCWRKESEFVAAGIDAEKGIDLRILITGINGFVGSYLTREMLRRGCEVLGVSRRDTPEDFYGHEKFTLIRSDLAGEALPPIEGIRAIFHFAGQAQPGGVSVTSYIRENILATQNLLTMALSSGVANFIFASSLSVYGEIRSPVADENTPITNPQGYGLSKYMGELLLGEASAKISSVALRLPGILGQNCRGPWLANILQKVKQNQTVSLFNPDAKFNNAVHLSDLADWLFSLAGRNLAGFNPLTVGSDGPLTILETVRYMIGQTGSASRIEIQGNGRPSFWISNERAKKEFGFRPMGMKELLARFIRENS